MKKRIRGFDSPPMPDICDMSDGEKWVKQLTYALSLKRCHCCNRWYEEKDSVPAIVVYKNKKVEGIICRYCCGSGQKFVELRKATTKTD